MADDKVIRRALYSGLAADTAITSLLATSTAIYHQQAPSESAFPFIIFSKQSGRPSYTFNATAFDQQTWLVKAVARSTTSDVAEDIDTAVDAELTNGALTITGHLLADMRRISDVSYLEADGDQQYRHAGALYRLTVL